MNCRACILLFFFTIFSCNLQVTLQATEAYNETSSFDDNVDLNRSYENEENSHRSESVGSHIGRSDNPGHDESSHTIIDGANGNISRSPALQFVRSHETTSSDSEVLASGAEIVTPNPDTTFYPSELSSSAFEVNFDPVTKVDSVTQETIQSQDTTYSIKEDGTSNNKGSTDDSSMTSISAIKHGSSNDNNGEETEESISLMQEDTVSRNDSITISKETSIPEHEKNGNNSSGGRTKMQDDSLNKNDAPDDHIDDTVDMIDKEKETVYGKQDHNIDDNNNDGTGDSENGGGVDAKSDVNDSKVDINNKDDNTGNNHDTKSEELADDTSRTFNISKIVNDSEGDGQSSNHDKYFQDDHKDTTIINTCPCNAPFDGTNRSECFFHLQSIKTLFKEYEDFIYTANGELYAAPSDGYYRYENGKTEQRGKYLKLEVNSILCDNNKKEITIEYPKFQLKDTGELELLAPGMNQTVPRGSYCLLQESISVPRENSGPSPIRVRMCTELRKFSRCCESGSSMTYKGCQPSSFHQQFRPPVTLLPNPIPEPLEAIDEVLHEIRCDHEPLADMAVEPDTVKILAPPLNNKVGILLKTFGQWNIMEDSFCIDGSQKDDGKSLYSIFFCRLSREYLKEQCSHDLCLRKCCPMGQIYSTSTFKCVDSEEPFLPVITSGSLEDYKTIAGYPTCGDYHIDESSVINADGTLNFDKRKLAMHEYCTDTFLMPNMSSTSIGKERSFMIRKGSLVCFREATFWERHRFTVFSICLSFSVFFLTMTIICHLSTPVLRTSHHRYTLSHMVSLLLGNIFLIVAQTGHNLLDERTCVVVAFLIHFTYLATFSWLNVMCFDIWRLARQQTRKHLVRRGEGSAWLQYGICSVYGWGAPFTSSLVAALIFNAPNTTLIKPDFGVKCFFNGDVPLLTYFYGPIAVMFIISLAMLFLAFRFKSSMTIMKKDSKGHFHIKSRAQRANWSLWARRKERKTTTEAKEEQSSTIEGADRQETSATARDSEEQMSDVCGNESPPTSLSTNPACATPSEPLRVHSKMDFRAEFWRQVTLFTLMVLCWVTEVISFAVGLPEIWIITDVLNSIQGFFIFMLFARNTKKRNNFLNANPRFAKCLRSVGLCGLYLSRHVSSIISYASSRSKDQTCNVPRTIPSLRGREKDGVVLNMNGGSIPHQRASKCMSIKSQSSNKTLISMLSTDSSNSSTSASELTPTPTDILTPDFIGVVFNTDGGRSLQVVEEEV